MQFILFGLVWLVFTLSCWNLSSCACQRAEEDMSTDCMAGIDADISWFACLQIRGWLCIVPVFHHSKISLQALSKSHEQTSITWGNESITQCVYSSSKLRYLSFSAEWPEVPLEELSHAHLHTELNTLHFCALSTQLQLVAVKKKKKKSFVLQHPTLTTCTHSPFQFQVQI